MQQNSMGRFRRALEALTEPRKTSKPPRSSNRSSTPMERESESTEPISSSSSMMPRVAEGRLSTPSISSDSVFVSSGPSSLFPDPEIEGECDVEFTVKIHGYGVYEKVEIEIAKTLKDLLRLNFGEHEFILKDEAGRYVVYADQAKELPTNNIIVVRKGI